MKAFLFSAAQRSKYFCINITHELRFVLIWSTELVELVLKYSVEYLLHLTEIWKREGERKLESLHRMILYHRNKNTTMDIDEGYFLYCGDKRDYWKRSVKQMLVKRSKVSITKCVAGSNVCAEEIKVLLDCEGKVSDLAFSF